MRHVTFLRRKALGSGIRNSVIFMNGMSSGTRRISVKRFEGEKASIIRNDQDLSTFRQDTLLIRLGCTTTTPVPIENQINNQYQGNKNMKIITEVTQELQYITEAKESGENNVFIEGIFMQAEKANRNNRLYRKNILEREVDKYQDLIKG